MDGKFSGGSDYQTEGILVGSYLSFSASKKRFSSSGIVEDLRRSEIQQ